MQPNEGKPTRSETTAHQQNVRISGKGFTLARHGILAKPLAKGRAAHLGLGGQEPLKSEAVGGESDGAEGRQERRRPRDSGQPSLARRGGGVAGAVKVVATLSVFKLY